MAALLKLIFLLTASGSGVLLARGGTFSLSKFLFLAVSISIALDTYAGIILLTMGRFSVNGIFAVSGFLLAAGLVIAAWRKGASLRLKGSRRDSALLLVIFVGAVFLLPPSEFLIENNDGNTYFCTGVNMARNGTWSIPDGFLAEIPAQLRPVLFEPFMVFREDRLIPLDYLSRFPGGLMLTGKSAVQPMFLPVYPIWVGIFYSLFGLHGIFFVGLLFALLGIGSLYLLAEAMELRIWTGILGALLLTGSFTQLWFGRFPSPEMLAQFFALGALVFWIDAFRTKKIFFVTVAVLLSGLLTFTKFEFLAVGVPVVLLLLIVWFLSRPGRPLAYFLVGFVYAAAVAGALVFLNNFSSSYYTLLRMSLGAKLAVLETACLVLAAVMLSLPLLERLRPAQALLNKLSQSRMQERIAVAFVLVFLFVVLYGYFLRPLFPLPGDLEMVPRRQMVVTLGNQFNLQRIGMLLSPPGLLLALAAVMAWIARLRTPQVVVVFFFLPSFLYFTHDVSAWPTYPWLLRRFVPIVFPVLYLGLAYALVERQDLMNGFRNLVSAQKRDKYLSLRWLKESRWGNFFRSLRNSAPGGFVSSSWTPRTTTLLFWIFLGYFYVSSFQAFSLPLIRETPMRGVFGQVEALAEKLPAESLVLIDQDLMGTHLAGVLSIIYGKRVLVLKDHEPAAATHPLTTEFLTQEHERGRKVFFLTRGPVRFEKGEFYAEPAFDQHLEYPYLRVDVDTRNVLQKVSVYGEETYFIAYEIVPKKYRKSKDVTVTKAWSGYGYRSGAFFEDAAGPTSGVLASAAPSGGIEIPKEASFPILRVTAKAAISSEHSDPESRTLLLCFLNGIHLGTHEISEKSAIVSFPAPGGNRPDGNRNVDELPADIRDRLFDFAKRELQPMSTASPSVDRIEWVAARIPPPFSIFKFLSRKMQPFEPGTVQLDWIHVRRDRMRLPFRIDVGGSGDVLFLDRQEKKLFYDPKRLNGGNFRWFQPDASIDLSPLRSLLSADATYRIRIQRPDLGPDRVRQGGQIYLGDRPLFSQITPGLNEAEVSGEELLRELRLTLNSPAWPSTDLYPDEKARLLGMAVDWVEIDEERSGEK